MKELGEMLRKNREEKGLTYEEIFEKTKIQPRYLKALEEGNMDVFPGEVYARGSLRNYARILGLEEEMILSRYYEDRGKYIETFSKEKKTKEKPLYTKGDGIWKNMIIGILAIILLFAGIQGYQYYYGTNNDRAVTLPSEDEERETPTPYEPDDWNDEELEEEEEREEDEEEPREGELILADNSNMDRVYHLLHQDKIEFKVTFSNRCWTRFSLDGEDAVDAEYGDGDVIEEEALEEIFIRLGNPGVAEVTVNGEELDLEGITSPINITIKILEEDPGNLENNSGSNE